MSSAQSLSNAVRELLDNAPGLVPLLNIHNGRRGDVAELKITVLVPLSEAASIAAALIASHKVLQKWT